MSNHPPNRLVAETSPYLQQHAHNPVDWFPWGDEAFEKARDENKPLLVSIGYSACHWCHVMERESFEDKETAAFMNQHFVNVKIDREERPDLDHIYMAAVQAITGSGGWPLNVFLTPEGKPFYGGTYFPPVRAFRRPSWKDVLEGMATAFRDRRHEIDAQSENLTDHIFRANGFGLKRPEDPWVFDEKTLDQVFEKIMKTADREEGGFGPAPKFPQTFTIRYLLQYYYYSGQSAALEQACLSLDKMIYGGINDQLGGGFARYSTDAEWLVPHFEKMLYDNALLITAISEAWQLTSRPHYRRAIEQTMEYARREMLAPGGGFYSALDADSEGVEGKYYVWDKAEVEQLLGPAADVFCKKYDITEKGNWEGKNILRIKKEDGFRDMTGGEGSDPFGKSLQILLDARNSRVRPQLDDKILVGWNALMITAACKAFAALGTESYRQMAVNGMDFLRSHCQGTGMYRYYHTYKNGKAAIQAFLDDYAYLIEALIQLQEVTGNTGYLEEARELTAYVTGYFRDEDSGYFFFTHQEQEDVIFRKKEIYDGAVPSGNAVMCHNMLYLSVVFNEPSWKQNVLALGAGLSKLIIQYPGSFGIWATLLFSITYGIREIVLAGTQSGTEHIQFLSNYIPDRVFQMASPGHDDFPLLRNKPLTGIAQYFLCREYSCQNPVNELTELIRLLGTR
jgi:uncharacterized protein